MVPCKIKRKLKFYSYISLLSSRQFFSPGNTLQTKPAALVQSYPNTVFPSKYIPIVFTFPKPTIGERCSCWRWVYSIACLTWTPLTWRETLADTCCLHSGKFHSGREDIHMTILMGGHYWVLNFIMVISFTIPEDAIILMNVSYYVCVLTNTYQLVSGCSVCCELWEMYA